MTAMVVLPSDIQTKDMMVSPFDPIETWPVVRELGDTYTDPDFGLTQRVHIEGQEDPWNLPAESPVYIERPTPEEEE